jgi:gas vesicle protein
MCGMRNSEFIGGILLGAVIGAAAGLLLAPMSGAEARSRIREGAGRVKDATISKGQRLFRRGEHGEAGMDQLEGE